MGVIGSEVNLAFWFEGLLATFGEPGGDEAIFVMTPFGPWVWKIDMECQEEVGWDQVFQDVGGLQANQAEILEFRPQSFAIELPEASQEPFHPDEIMPGVRGCVLSEKGSVA